MTVKEKLVKWEKKLEETKLEYPAEDIKGFVEELKADGIILAFGMSDDLLEFSGALNDECEAWNGTVERLVPHKDGSVSVFDEDENKETAELNRLQIRRLTEVRANWCPENEKKEIWASWHITSPDSEFFGSFDIFEDGELYCRGLIIPVERLENPKEE